MLANLLTTRAIANETLQAWGRGLDDDGATAPTGIRVNETTALSILAVLADVRLIGELVATMPLDGYRTGGPGEKKVVTELPGFITAPNKETSQIEYLSQTMTSLLLRGNSYDLIVNGPDGTTRELWKLNPDEVYIVRPAPGQPAVYYVNGAFIPAKNIGHIRGFSLPGRVMGVDPIQYAATAFGLGIAAQEYGARFFAQSALPAAVIEAPGSVTQEQIASIRDQFLRWHSGIRNAHKPAVLSGGLSYKPVSILPEQAQFLQTRQLSDSQIHRLFGINPFSDGESMTYANVEQRGIDVVKYTTNPWTVRIEEYLSRLWEINRSVRFNVDALQRADLRTRYESHRIALDGGFLTVNEVRDIEDREPLDEGGGDEASSARAVAELIQKIYLGVDVVLSAEEARAIANRAGANLEGPLPKDDPEPVDDSPDPFSDPATEAAAATEPRNYRIEYSKEGRVLGIRADDN